MIDRLVQATGSSNVSYAEMMLATVRSGNETLLMYFGLCSVVSYVTNAAWKLVYLAVARSPARQSITDNGLLELFSLLNAYLMCSLLRISVTDMFSFPILFITGLISIMWMFRGIKPLLFSNDRQTHIRAAVAYLAAIFGLPLFVAVSLAKTQNNNYAFGNMFIALRFSVRGASTLIQSVIRRWNLKSDTYNYDVNFVITVSTACG